MKKPFDENEYFDRWVRQYSKAVNTNMCPYFIWFKMTITEETKTLCETLPSNSFKYYRGQFVNILHGDFTRTDPKSTKKITTT